MSASVNVLAMPQPNIPALLAWVAKAKPPYAVVMDGPDIATRIRMVSPNTQIIFRRYRADDAKLHETTSPTAFLESVADLPGAWIAQALNEPGGDQAQLANWCAALVRLADVHERRLALPNFSTGNPDPEAVADGLYDPLWRAMAASGRHVLGLHEYALVDPASEPWHVGRYHAILRRFDALGLKRPTVVMTEHGRDLAGGRDGWRAVFNEEQYADFLETAQETYRPDGVCACVFSWGGGFEGRWATYDVQGAPVVLEAMAAMNEAGEDDVVPGYRRVKAGPSGVNVRVAPGLKHQAISVARTGDWAKTLPGNTVKADGYTWQPIVLDQSELHHVHGWVALEVIEFV
jgi:hypothetical protein